MGYMEIGDITALSEYAILILFYLIMAQMVMITLPRSLVCVERIREVPEKEPEINDPKTEDETEDSQGGRRDQISTMSASIFPTLTRIL